MTSNDEGTRGDGMRAAIRTCNIYKSFRNTDRGQDSPSIFQDFNLEIREGEFVVILGPTGCGKTTLLNLFAGLEQPDKGRISRHLNAHTTSIGYVFQSHHDTLLPWRTIGANLELPLEYHGYPPAQRKIKIINSLKQIGLEAYSRRYPYQLSGGQRQLLAIARSRIYSPKLMLLDEPLSSLDHWTSREVWTRLRTLWRDEVTTTVYVSHDIDEALFLGDRILILAGRPATILADIAVSFGKDRSLDILASEEFLRMRQVILRALKESKL